jgi:NADPH2:quinone reductase
VSGTGRRVVASLNGTGGYAERVLSPAARLIEVPDALAMRDAVALLADGRTALALAAAAAAHAAIEARTTVGKTLLTVPR